MVIRLSSLNLMSESVRSNKGWGAHGASGVTNSVEECELLDVGLFVLTEITAADPSEDSCI